MTTLFLAACSTGTGSGATYDTTRYLFERVAGRTTESARVFNPAYNYLRVTYENAEAYMVLGYVDSIQGGPVEVWYSGKREVIRLGNGRILGTSGLPSDWREVRIQDAPSWDALLRSSEVTQYRRLRDVMPGYHFGIEEQVKVVRLSAYNPLALKGRSPDSLAWFEERDVARTAGVAALPPARFGVARDENGLASVVYSEQCLSPDVCYTFERWKAPTATAPSTAAGS